MNNRSHHDVEIKLNTIKSTMDFEGMKLPETTVDLYRRVLAGECTIEAARQMIIREHLG